MEEHFLDTGENPVTTYEYDSYGNRNKTTDPEQRATTVKYDSLFQTFPVEVTNAKGQTTVREFNPANGQPTMVKDPNGFVTTYKYDVFNRLIKEIKPGDNETYPTTQIAYFLDGVAPEGVMVSKRETSATSNTLDAIQFVDGLGRLIQTKTEYKTTANRVATDVYYDTMGRVFKHSNPYLADSSTNYSTPQTTPAAPATVTDYDTMGRVIKTTNPDATYATTTYDHWTVTANDENSHVKIRSYDANKNLSQVVEKNHVGVSGNTITKIDESYTTKYQNNSLGELLQTSDNYGNIVKYVYDTLGRKITAIDPDQGQKSYAYDLVGNLNQQTDARGVVTKFTFDPLNRPLQVVYPKDKGVQYTYDQGTIGTLSQVTDSLGTVAYKYDSRLRQVQEDRTMDGMTWTTKWAYDAMDRLASQTYPDGNTVSFAYNTMGELNGIATILNSIDYNERGQEIQRDYVNSLSTKFDYTPTNQRLKTITTAGIQDYSYGYDSTGNVQAIVTNAGDPPNKRTETFTYDDLDRLVNAQDPGANGYNNTYAYNAIGNMLSETDVNNGVSSVAQYTYGLVNALPHAVMGKSDTKPLIGLFSLNGGKAYSTTQTVTLNNIAMGSPTEYMASQKADFSDASWKPYSTNPSFVLSSGYGAKTVYFKVRNQPNVETSVVSGDIQYLLDSKGSGIPDIYNPDMDNDGIPDAWERANGIDTTVPGHASLDPDHDGLTNLQEYLHGTNPNSADSDNDGWSDSVEIANGTNPNSNGIDNVHDGVSANFSLQLGNFNQGGGLRSSTTYSAMDTLGKAISVNALPDGDGDGIPDIVDPDADNDGIPDAWERANGINLTVPGHAQLDPDHDGLTNLQEYLHGTNPNKADSDGDGLSDYKEIYVDHSDPNAINTFQPAVSENYSLVSAGFNMGGNSRSGTTTMIADRVGSQWNGNALNNNCNAAVAPTMIDFGVVDANGQVSQITVANQGSGNFIIGVISIDGENGLEFTTQSDTCSNQTIAPHGSCTVSVRFMPAFAGAKGALLHVPTSDLLASNLSVNLSGTASATVIDQTPPSGGIVRINSGASITNSEQVTLTLSAQDASGVAGMCISNSNVCSNWEPFAAGRIWALPEGDGTYTVYVWFRDSVGNPNVTPYTATITLDTVIPTMSASVQGGMYKNAQTVALTSSKPGTIYYTLDGTNPTKGSSVYSTPLQLTTHAELKFLAVDRAGNQSEIGAEVYTISVSSTTIKPGDCDASGTVTIAEVQSAVNMFLGLRPVLACVDMDGNGQVSISEVQKVINAFLGL